MPKAQSVIAEGMDERPDQGMDERVRRRPRLLSERTLTGLYFLSKYRFLTISQFARAASFSLSHAGEALRGLNQWGVVGYFGFVGIPGQGKTPKVYYLTRKGWRILTRDSELPDEDLSVFNEVQSDTTWSPHMYHRLRLIDLLISAECSARQRPHLTLVKSFLEYRMVKKGGITRRETTDFVAKEEFSDNKILPDAAFILENRQTRRRALFFLEMDMGSERITSPVTGDQKSTIQFKFSQYDRYLTSMRYAETYAKWGEFRSFVLLFVTLNDARVDNIRRHLQDFPAEYANFFRFTSFDKAMGDFLSAIWKSRLATDTNLYPLVRE